KTDLGIAARYVETLVPQRLRHVFATIREEYDRTVAQVLAITGESATLERQPVLRRTLAVRDTYLEPLHHLQVALLAQYRMSSGRRGRRGGHLADPGRLAGHRRSGTADRRRRARRVPPAAPYPGRGQGDAAARTGTRDRGRTAAAPAAVGGAGAGHPNAAGSS